MSLSVFLSHYFNGIIGTYVLFERIWRKNCDYFKAKNEESENVRIFYKNDFCYVEIFILRFSLSWL